MRFARTLVAGPPVEGTFFVPTRFGLSAEATPGDWMALARSYLSHGHPAAALQTLSLAMDLERADAERFGGAAPERAGARGVTPPQKISGDQPKYPPHAMAAKVQGLVIIEALIDPAGRVGRARVLKPVAGLESAALDAVQSWRYSPAKLDGKPTTTILVVSVSFQLR
jgi:TonB family protein